MCAVVSYSSNLCFSMANDVAHPLLYLFAIHISSLVKDLLKSFVSILMCLYIIYHAVLEIKPKVFWMLGKPSMNELHPSSMCLYFYCIFQSSSYLINTKTLSDIYLQIISPSLF